MIVDMSFSLILTLRCFKIKRFNLFKLSKGVHWSAKNMFNRSAFSEKFVIMSPFTSGGGIAGVFVLFRKRFSIDQ